MAELDQQIRLVREQAADRKTAEENTRALEQKKRDLEAARRLAEQAVSVSVSTKPETGAVPHNSLASSLKGTPICR